MTIKDAKTAAEIAAMCPEAWWLIGLSLKTGVVLRPKDMTNAAWGRAIRYMESRALAVIDPITGAYKLQGALADQLFGEKKAKPKKEKPVEQWRLDIVEKGGSEEDIIKAVPDCIPYEQALFYRTELTKAYKNDSYAKYRRIVGTICGWVKVDGGYTRLKPLENILAMREPIGYECMAYPWIAKASVEDIEEKLITMDNHKTVASGQRVSVAKTLSTYLKPKPWEI